MTKHMDKTHRKKSRTIETLNAIEHRYHIFCEGTKTEPLYFKGFKDSIENNPVYKNVIQIEIIGTGQSTKNIINIARENVKTTKIMHAEIWCLYDKDDFPEDDFNSVSLTVDDLNSNTETSSDVSYHVAWSNQCFEYWVILHFKNYKSNTHRDCYIETLDKEFMRIVGTTYKKNNECLFDHLTTYGNPKLAIKWAKDQILECKDLTDAKSAPATKVYLLVEKLAIYLPDNIKSKYI